MSVAYLNFKDWRDQNKVFSGIATYQGNSFNLTDLGEPEHLFAQNISPSLFSILGVAPMLGRTFMESENKAGILDDSVFAPREVVRNSNRDFVRIEARQSAQIRGRVEIDDQHVQRAVGLGLKLETTLDLQR